MADFHFMLTPIGRREVKPSLFNFNFGSGSKSSKTNGASPLLVGSSRRKSESKKTPSENTRKQAHANNEASSSSSVSEDSPLIAGASTSTSPKRGSSNVKKSNTSKTNNHEERKEVIRTTNASESKGTSFENKGLSPRKNLKQPITSGGSSNKKLKKGQLIDHDDNECEILSDSETERRSKIPLKRASVRLRQGELTHRESSDLSPPQSKKSKNQASKKKLKRGGNINGKSINNEIANVNEQDELNSSRSALVSTPNTNQRQIHPSNDCEEDYEEDDGTELGEEDEASEIKLIIEENGEEYKHLRNSDYTNNLIQLPKELVSKVAGFMDPKFTSDNSQEEYPGVDRTFGIEESGDSFSFGYLRIKGRTVKPPEACGDGKLMYWILDGALTVKSAGGFYKVAENGEANYLFGKELSGGVCIVIPKGTVYTFENWRADDALLSYCLIRQSDEESILSEN